MGVGVSVGVRVGVCCACVVRAWCERGAGVMQVGGRRGAGGGRVGGGQGVGGRAGGRTVCVLRACWGHAAGGGRRAGSFTGGVYATISGYMYTSVLSHYCVWEESAPVIRCNNSLIRMSPSSLSYACPGSCVLPLCLPRCDQLNCCRVFANDTFLGLNSVQ